MADAKKAPSGKWITGVDPSHPALRAAKTVLNSRWRTVRYWARLAGKHWQREPEYVHQLRVNCRRAAVAGELFAEFLPRRKGRRVKKWLSQLRRSAGRARDLDVLIERLVAERQLDAKTGQDHVRLLPFLRRQRQSAQADLQVMTSKSGRRAAAQMLKSLKWRAKDKTTTFFTMAYRVLPPILDDFFAAAQSDLATIEAIHQLRIKGKKARYAMETLAGAFSEPFRCELYSSLCDVQQFLGDINDMATAVELFQSWLPDARPKLQTDLAQQRDQAAAQLERLCREFRSSWKPQTVERLQQRFAEAWDSLSCPESEPVAFRFRNPEPP